MEVNQIRPFLSAHLSLVQILLFAVTAGTLWWSEAYVSEGLIYKKWQHTSTNAFLVFSALPIQLAFNTLLALLTDTEATHHWGLVYLEISSCPSHRY